jgi:membrane protease YdiL (CAAX protease family)
LAILERLRRSFWQIAWHRRLVAWRRVAVVYLFGLIVWGGYRWLSPLPVWIEEIFLKGLVFGLPVFWMVFGREKQGFASLGMTTKRLFEAVYLGLSLGAFFWVFGQVVNWFRYQGGVTLGEIWPTSAEFGALLLLAMVTAWWEELLFMGYLLPRLVKLMAAEGRAVWLTAGLFTLINVPAIWGRGAGLAQAGLQVGLLCTLGLGNGVLMLRTKNLAAPILTHALWGVTMYLLV